jgi:hypothetical protein
MARLISAASLPFFRLLVAMKMNGPVINFSLPWGPYPEAREGECSIERSVVTLDSIEDRVGHGAGM